MVPLKNLRRCHCGLLLLLFYTPAYTQITITGRVVGEKENRPVPNAHVYFNNTTIGTTTGKEGSFTFDNVKLLNTEMVISCPGYETLVFIPDAAQIANKRLLVKLATRTMIPKSALIYTNETNRQNALAIFYDNFLGITEEAQKCKVQNENGLYFTKGDNNTSFAAYIDTPLVVINTMLGYKMSLDLVEFTYDEATGRNYLLGYTFYEQLAGDKNWAKNRRNCYYGSTMHFYRSLIANQLYQQGFNTFLIPPVTDSAKINLFYNDPDAEVAAERIRAVPVSAQQVLYIDSTNNFSIKVNGKLLVQYAKNPSTKKYLAQHLFYDGQLEKGTESYLQFKTPSIGINSAGVLSDLASVSYTGYWIYERAANVLPFDYVPD